MATATATANTAAQDLFTVPLHMRGIVDGIDVNNQGTSGTIKFTIQDVFSQDLSHGNSSVTSHTATPWNISVGQGVYANADDESLKGLTIIGAAKVIADNIDASADFTIRFHFE